VGCGRNEVAPNAMNVNISLYFSPQVCIRVCQTMGYSVAVVSGDNHGCYCQFTVNTDEHMVLVGIEKEEKCLKPCKNDPDFSCGNYPFKHFYLTGNQGYHCTFIRKQKPVYKKPL